MVSSEKLLTFGIVLKFYFITMKEGFLSFLLMCNADTSFLECLLRVKEKWGQMVDVMG